MLNQQIYQVMPADYVTLTKALRPQSVTQLAQLLDEIAVADQAMPDKSPGFYMLAATDPPIPLPWEHKDSDFQKKINFPPKTILSVFT